MYIPHTEYAVGTTTYYGVVRREPHSSQNEADSENFVLKEAFDEMYNYEESLHLLLLVEQPMQGRKLTLFICNSLQQNPKKTLTK